MSHSPVSILSRTDFNGREIPEDRFLATFHEMMEEHGYVLITNVPDSFDQAAFCRRLGPFVPNYNGAVVGDVKPQPGMDDVYHSGNTKPLTPHTEGYDFEITPPRYIALWCVHPAAGPGGETTLADTRTWVADLDDDERKRLYQTDYEWKTTDGVKRLGLDLQTFHPVLEEVGDQDIVRFSCNNLLRDAEDPAADLQVRWHQRFDDEYVAIDYQRNDTLVWDNWRLLHARNGFQDRQRHLRRIQVGAATPVGVG